MTKIASCLVLALLSLTQAEPNDVNGCIMGNMGAINSMIDSALFIYAATKHCKSSSDRKQTASCVSDLASVVATVTGVGEFMIKVFNTCGEIKTANRACAAAGLHLTGSLASVTAASAAASKDCSPPGDSFKPTPEKYGAKKWSYTGAGGCVLNVGLAMSGLQHAIISMMTVKGKCGEKNDGAKCFAAVTDIISGVGFLAVFIEGAVSNCDHGSPTIKNSCQTDIAFVLAGLASTASSIARIKSGCTAQSTRLYTDGSVEMSEPTAFGGANIISAMLLGFLPVAGLISYYGGSRFTRATRSTRQFQNSGILE